VRESSLEKFALRRLKLGFAAWAHSTSDGNMDGHN
jgi:hypothetical protein